MANERHGYDELVQVAVLCVAHDGRQCVGESCCATATVSRYSDTVDGIADLLNLQDTAHNAEGIIRSTWRSRVGARELNKFAQVKPELYLGLLRFRKVGWVGQLAQGVWNEVLVGEKAL